MTEREKLEILLEEVKQKIRMINAIEQRLIEMREIAIKSSDTIILNAERSKFQLEINHLIQEIELLEVDSTIYQ